MDQSPAQPPVTLTPKALAEAERLAGDAAHAGKALRVYIEGKGCDGFYYGVSFDDANERDERFAQGSLTLVVDPDSRQFLAGSTIDWVDDERGRGFLVDNPGHRRFRGKFYKKSEWRERLTSSSRAGASSPPADR
jgi:iron-sulfur cluster insertion protein